MLPSRLLSKGFLGIDGIRLNLWNPPPFMTRPPASAPVFSTSSFRLSLDNVCPRDNERLCPLLPRDVDRGKPYPERRDEFDNGSPSLSTFLNFSGSSRWSPFLALKLDGDPFTNGLLLSAVTPFSDGVPFPDDVFFPTSVPFPDVVPFPGDVLFLDGVLFPDDGLLPGEFFTGVEVELEDALLLDGVPLPDGRSFMDLGVFFNLRRDDGASITNGSPSSESVDNARLRSSSWFFPFGRGVATAIGVG